jgi:SAM-dependent methyltransferase
MTKQDSSIAKREIAHGKKLLVSDPEKIWGWGTPAGKLRARRRAKLIANGVGLKPGMSALEIGCGTGNFTERFAETGTNIVAVDISPGLLESARKRCLPECQVQFLVTRFEDCKSDVPFDAIIGSSVLHHLNLIESLVKIRELLKPGGIMCFAEPNLLNPQVFLERKLRWLPIFQYVSPDETAFVRWRLYEVLKKCGFTDIEIKPFDWLHPLTPNRFIKVVNNVGFWMEKTPILREFAGSLYIYAKRPSDIKHRLK